MARWGKEDILTDPAAILAQSPFRILVVEDDVVHFTYCEGLLAGIFGDKLQLDRATDCTTAIERLNSNSYEVCLLDYMVEGGDAKDILSGVNFGLVNTPVIVVSAFDDKSFIQDALKYGADDYVIKGQFNRAQLEQAIQYAVYRKHKELVLRQRALHDPLTGLANRHLLLDRLDEVHRYAVRYGEKYAVMMVDLDKLKSMNDTFGHEAGDRYILSAAKAILSCTRSSDTVARVGGDEFVAILKNIRAKENMVRIVSAVVGAVGAHQREPGQSFSPGCSIGMAVYPDDGETPDDLLRAADAAMYTAKRAGGGGWRLA